MHIQYCLGDISWHKDPKKRTLKRTLVAFSVCVNLKKDPHKKVLMPTDMSKTIRRNSMYTYFYARECKFTWSVHTYIQILSRIIIFLFVKEFVPANFIQL